MTPPRGSRSGKSRPGGRPAISRRRSRTSNDRAGGKIKGVRSLTFSPDGTRLAAGTRDRVTVWRVRGDLPVGHTWSGPGYRLSPSRELHKISGLTFVGRNWELLASGGHLDPRVVDRAELLIHEPEREGLPRVLANHLRRYELLTSSSDGIRVAFLATDRTVSVRDVESGEEVGRVQTPGRVDALAFGPDGRHLLTGEGDGAVRMWDYSREPGVEVIRAEPTDRMFGLAVLDGGRSVAFTSATVAPAAARLGVRNRQDGSSAYLPLGPSDLAPADLAVSPDELSLAVGMKDGSVQLWDWRGRKQRAVLLAGRTSPILRVAFTPDGRLMAAATDGGLWTWVLDRPDEPCELLRHEGRLSGMAVSPDGQAVAVCGDGGDVAVVRPDTGEVVRVFQTGARQATAASFCPDGRWLAVGTFEPTSIQVWDWRTGTLATRAEDTHDERVTFVLFTCDGRRLLTGSLDGTVKVWDAGRCVELLILKGHGAPVNRGVLTTDGLLFTSSWDGTVRVWDGRPAR